MAGEIRDALSRFKAAHLRMTENIVAEMDKATAQTAVVEKEGIAAVQLPAAMIAATRAEIRDITAEFATQTNGAPVSPLPGEVKNSAVPSATSATTQQPSVAPPAQSAEKKT